MCNEIECNGKRPKPLSEEERAMDVLWARQQVTSALPAPRGIALAILRWAATVAERDKRIEAVRKAGKELLNYLYVFGAGSPQKLEGLVDHCRRLDKLVSGEEEGDGD